MSDRRKLKSDRDVALGAIQELQRLRSVLESMALFAASEAADLSKRYPARPVDLASAVSALRIIEGDCRRALEATRP